MAFEQLTKVVLGAVVVFIMAGLGVYVLNEFASASNSSVVQTLSDKLGNWATVWFPILLIVIIAVVIIGLVSGLGKVGGARGR